MFGLRELAMFALTNQPYRHCSMRTAVPAVGTITRRTDPTRFIPRRCRGSLYAIGEGTDEGTT